MVKPDHQKAEFQSRLARIKKGGPNMLGQVYVGPQDEPSSRAAERAHFGFFATLFALVFGACAYFLGNLAQYHLTSGASPQAGAGEWSAFMVMTDFGDILLAFVMLFVLVRASRMKGLGPWLVGSLGLFAMMGLYSIAIQSAPELYSALYSTEFVDQYTRTTFDTMPF